MKLYLLVLFILRLLSDRVCENGKDNNFGVQS